MEAQFPDVRSMVAALKPSYPVYCLRPHVLRKTVQRFLELFPGRVLYAVKCNPHPAGAAGTVQVRHPPFRHRLAAGDRPGAGELSRRRRLFHASGEGPGGHQHHRPCLWHRYLRRRSPGRADQGAGRDRRRRGPHHRRARQDAAGGGHLLSSRRQVRRRAGRGGGAAEGGALARLRGRALLPCRIAMPGARRLYRWR